MILKIQPPQYIGLGQFRKELLTDFKKNNHQAIFASHNDVIFNCDNQEELKEFLLISNLILGDIKLLGNHIKKSHNFYYATNPNRKITSVSKYKNKIARLSPKAALQYAIYMNFDTSRVKFFEDYILREILADFIKTANWYRVEKIINTAVLLGANYTYFYHNIDKI